MNRRTRILYRIHSWSGIVFGVALFILSLSGAIAVFGDELDGWANPELLAVDTDKPDIGLDKAIAAFVRDGSMGGADASYLILPRDGFAFYELIAPTPEDPQARRQVHVDADTVVHLRTNHSYYFLRHLHVRLFLPGGWGRPVVGLLGVIMALSIISGIIIHRHIFRDLLLMRWGRSFRVVVSDLHKVLGVWAVLFHLVIALTGAWLGLEGYLTGLSGYAARGDEGKPIYALEAPFEEPSPVPGSRWASIAAMVQAAEQRIPGFEASHVDLPGGSDPGIINVRGNLDGDLIQRAMAEVKFNARTGDILELHDPRGKDWTARVHATLEPLHYGYFGGIWVKLLYFILGMVPAILVLTGTLVYADRTARKTRPSARVPIAAGQLS